MGGTATVTILFCDLVGSTALHARLGDEAVDGLRRKCFAAWRDAVAANNGVEVKNQGDGLMVVFTSSTDALAAAAEMQTATQRVDRAERQGLALRVGVSVGEATSEDGDWFGTPVNEAARLCAAASSGQVLVVDLVRALVGSRGGHQFVSVGSLELKGLAEPLAASELVWEPADAGATPLPPALLTSEPFVGREAELATLIDEWERVRAGERRLVLAAGEPGIGKTRLAAEFAGLVRRGNEHDAYVLYGRCDETYTIPFQPIAEALRTFLEQCPPDDRVELCAQAPLAGELTRIVPSLPALVAGLPAPLDGDPDTERFRLYEAVCEFLAAMSSRAPVLFVLDDLHWAPRLDVVAHVLRSPLPLRLLVLGTYRDTDLGRTHPFGETLATLRRDPGYQRLALRGLDETEVGALVAANHLDELRGARAAVAQAVHAETEGNPFFVTEVLRHLGENPVEVTDDRHWTPERAIDAFGIPEGVREVVGRRVSRLAPDTNDVLATAAVVGREFDVAVVAAAAEMSSDSVLVALEEAESSRLVVPVERRPGRFSFAHALIRTTLYEELPTTRRLRVHRLVAHAIEQRGVDDHLPELAYHYTEAAALGEADRAFEYTIRAARAAAEALAFEQAAIHYAQARNVLELNDSIDPIVECDLLTARAEVLRRAGDAESFRLLERAQAIAREQGDGVRLARAVLARNPSGLASATGGVDEEMIALTDEALVALGDADPALRARLLALRSSEMMWAENKPERFALCREAMELARASGDRSALAMVLVGTHDSLWTPDNLSERLAIDDELIALGDDGDLEAGFAGRRFLVEERIEEADAPEVEAETRRTRELANALPIPYVRYTLTMLDVALSLLRGELDAAQRFIDECLESAARAQVPDSVRFPVWAAHAYMLFYERGLLGEVADAVEETPLAFEAAKHLFRIETDEPEAARAWYDAQLASDLRDLPVNFTWYLPGVTLARLAWVYGDAEGAARIEALLAPFSGRFAWIGIAAIGPVDLPLALLAATQGHDDVATTRFQAAIDLSEAMGARPYQARSRLEWAQMLASRGDRAGARVLAREALDIAEAVGMFRVAAQSRALLS